MKSPADQVDTRLRGALFGALGGLVAEILSEIVLFPGWDRRGPTRAADFGQVLVTDAIWGAVCGAFIGIALALAANSWVSEARPRLKRNVAVGAVAGMVGGAIGLVFGELAFQVLLGLICVGRAAGYALFGAILGSVQGIARRSLRGTFNAALGGMIGGAIGGFLFDLIGLVLGGSVLSRVVNITIIGFFIGLLIVVFQASLAGGVLKVLSGKLEGREFYLDKPLLTIGSSDVCDIALFGDPGVLARHGSIRSVGSGRHELVLSRGAVASVNGQQIVAGTAVLSAEERLVIGNTQLVYRQRNSSHQGQRVTAGVRHASATGLDKGKLDFEPLPSGDAQAGNATPPPRICPTCGRHLAPAARFCGACGTRLSICVFVLLTSIVLSPSAVQGATPAPPAGSTYRITRRIDASAYPDISLFVTVTDDGGRFVGELAKDHFVVREDGKDVDITGFAAEGQSRPLDVVFVFDVTSSMGPYIDGVKRTCLAFAEKLKNKNRDFRLGIVGFRDDISPRDVYGTDGDMTQDIALFREWVSRLRALEGGDGPENSLDALVYAAGKMRMRRDAQRVFLLITDAPPHYRGELRLPILGAGSDLTMDDAVNSLRKAGVILYTVGPGIVIDQMPGNAKSYSDMAREAGGDFYRIGDDFTVIIDKIGADLASQYLIRFRSPNPSSDGRRRDIEVQVVQGGIPWVSSSDSYLQKTLLNIQSRSPAGLATFVACALPLLALLLLPLAAQRRKSGVRPNPVAGVKGKVCPGCGVAQKSDARFCGNCGLRL